jgi:hypothetical protein
MKQLVNLFKVLLWIAIVVGTTMASNAQTCTYNQVILTETLNPTFPTFDTDATIEFDGQSVLMYEYGKPNTQYEIITAADTSYIEPIIISKFARNGGMIWDTAYHVAVAIKMKKVNSNSDNTVDEWGYLILDFVNNSTCPNLMVFTDYGGYEEWLSIRDKSRALVQLVTYHECRIYYSVSEK